MSIDGLIIEYMDLSHIHLAVINLALQIRKIEGCSGIRILQFETPWLAYVPADIHCCHRWSDITDGTWSPLCNAGGIQFYIFRHKLGCTP